MNWTWRWIFLVFVFLMCSVSKACTTPAEMVNTDIQPLLNDTVLLDLKGEYGWEILTRPYKYSMKYFNSVEEIEIDQKYLNSSVEIDLAPLKGPKGIWVHPYTERFNETFYAYFANGNLMQFFDGLEIFGFLRGKTELRLYNNLTEGVDPVETFTSNQTTIRWESFSVQWNESRIIRIEIQPTQYGEFGFLDKVVGLYSLNTRPPPFGVTEGTKMTTPISNNGTSTYTVSPAFTTSKSEPTVTETETSATVATSEQTPNSSSKTCTVFFGVFLGLWLAIIM